MNVTFNIHGAREIVAKAFDTKSGKSWLELTFVDEAGHEFQIAGFMPSAHHADSYALAINTARECLAGRPVEVAHG